MPQQLLKEFGNGSKNALIKKRIIKFYIQNGNSTIQDLSKELDLSVPTVTKFIDEMCSNGYLSVYGKLETAGGRHPNLYGLNPESGYFIGVDIKHSSLHIGLIDFCGVMVEKKTNIPFANNNTHESLEELVEITRRFIGELQIPHDKIMNVNFNFSGRVNSSTGYSYSIYNFDERPLTEVLSEKIGYSVSIENDTRAMTYGEYLKGNTRGEKDIIFVNISWGLGIGIIVNGDIYTGKSGFAGEFGHIITYDNEILCHCGKKGCIETEASGVALHRKLSERMNNGEISSLSSKYNSKEEITLVDIVEATNNDDVMCIELIEEIGNNLGKHIAGLINLFNPELVIIGGTLSLTGDYILQPVKTAVRKYSLNLVNKDTGIYISKLGSNAGLIGSCLIARSRLFEE